MAVVTSLSPSDFPPLLSEIPDTPKQLFIRGKVPDWNKKFLCVVGARRYTQYGKEACETLIRGLASYPIVIVSGLALGIDSIAHEAALGARLTTVAVPGSGLDSSVLYPATHRGLAEKIIANGGALLSEFEPNFKATPWSFPQRNRIMAGMSHAVLVIEAEKKSGTLITSRLATEYNRDVFTVPGSIFSPNTEGPHMLLRLGATPVTNSGELLEALGFKKTEEAQASRDYKDCTPEEQKILHLLQEPMARNVLIQKLKLPIHQANAILSVLEIKGLIRENFGEIHLS